MFIKKGMYYLRNENSKQCRGIRKHRKVGKERGR
jgi:hypothetical protein